VSGIDGEKSSLVTEQLRIIEDLGIPINIFENAEALIRKGLDRILVELNEMGYIVEWETISATAFNFPHYRHRVYVVAYLPDTAIAQTNSRVFVSVRWVAQYNLEKPFKFPLLNEDPDFVRANAVAEDTRAIKLRTKRINGLGNAVLPSIPKAIFDSITHIELDKVLDDDTLSAFEESMPAAFSVEDGVMCDLSGVHAPVMPTRGIMKGGVVYSDQKRCPLLNPTKTAYSGLYSTLIRKDGHNFTTKSRLNRPGKLGGLVGEIMSIGVDKGGLHPEFCEMFMDYSPGYTELKPPPAPIR
jgi:DNA (cytosine-5)-methyltransferase 1